MLASNRFLPISIVDDDFLERLDLGHCSAFVPSSAKTEKEGTAKLP